MAAIKQRMKSAGPNADPIGNLFQNLSTDQNPATKLNLFQIVCRRSAGMTVGFDFRNPPIQGKLL
jgi:hypothetical protein